MKHPTNTSLRIGRALLAALALGFAATSAAFASDTRYYVNDHLATTVGIADAAGEIAAIEADAFGSPLAGGANSGRFTGKPYDEDLGAYVFPFRNYRADEARWMSADPSGFPDGVNSNYYAPSAFVGVDPLGLATVVRVENPGDWSYGGPTLGNIDYSGANSRGKYPKNASQGQAWQTHNSWELFGAGGLAGNKGQAFSVSIGGTVTVSGTLSVQLGKDPVKFNIGGSAGVSVTSGGQFTMAAPAAHQWWQAELVYATYDVRTVYRSTTVATWHSSGSPSTLNSWSAWGPETVTDTGVRSMNVGVRWTLLE
jgi:RHS repeat-associated protein